MKKSVSLAVQTDSMFSPFPAAEFEQGLDWAQAIGAHGVELIVHRPDDIDCSKLKTMLSERGLSVSTLATGQAVMDGLSLTDPDPGVRAESIIRMEGHFRMSEKLGRPNVTVGLIRGKSNAAEIGSGLERLKEALYVLAEKSNGLGITINLEPINRYECALLNSCEETLAFLDDIGNPAGIGILFDTFHANIEDQEPCGLIKKLSGNISHVHLADSNRRLPGEGHIDFSNIMRSLKHAGFNGYGSLEILNLPDCSHVIGNAGACLNALFNDEV